MNEQMDLLTLKDAGRVISANNGNLPIAVSTLQSWAKNGALPTSRLGKMYVVDRGVAENFVVADRVRPKGNPAWTAGTPRPKWARCDRFAPEDGRCKKKARWAVTVEMSHCTMLIKRCDRHKDLLLTLAKDYEFEARISKVEAIAETKLALDNSAEV